jgi:hypothetical protein
MPNVSDIKPWFQEDIARTLMSIYFASVSSSSMKSESDEQFRIGFTTALTSVALAVGVKPETFLTPDDIKLIKDSTQ